MLPFQKNEEPFFLKKWLDPLVISERVEAFKKENKKVATLNGSFDLLHAGHLYIIYEASKQADLLIVALNSDDSIQKYKNSLRPIVPLKYRLKMIAALECVNYVTFFDGTDPRELLEKIKPHVHVNGIEYEENCIEGECVKKNGGVLHFVRRIPELSTSALIKKIIDTCD